MLSFEEALTYAKKRKIVLPQDFYDSKNKDIRSQLMTVSNLNALAQIQQVTASLEQALKDGDTFENWKKRALQNPELAALPPDRLETIFRNYIQTAYNSGRFSQFQANKMAVPYLMYSAINDARTTDICRARNGIIRKVDDPFWNGNSPMMHHRCRSTLISLTASQAKSRSGKDTGLNQPESDIPAADGWGKLPNTENIRKSLFDRFTDMLKGVPDFFRDKINKIFTKGAS